MERIIKENHFYMYQYHLFFFFSNGPLFLRMTNWIVKMHRIHYRQIMAGQSYQRESISSTLGAYDVLPRFRHLGPEPAF